jgi:chemotaxis signal transduction protein
MTDNAALASRALELRREFDAAFAAPPAATRRATIDLLDIALAGHPCALRADEIAGIHLDLVVTPIPGPLSELAGVTALRGALLPVYDLGLVFGAGACAGRWIVLDAARTVGFAFTEFHGHLRIDAADLAAHDGGEASALAPYVARVGTAARPVLSIPSLVDTVRQRASRANARKG